MGTEVGKISPVIGKLSRWGLLEIFGKRVYMTGLGWHALIASGFEPQDLNGKTLKDILKPEHTPASPSALP